MNPAVAAARAPETAAAGFTMFMRLKSFSRSSPTGACPPIPAKIWLCKSALNWIWQEQS